MTLFFSWLLQVLLALTLLAIPPACAVSISTNDPFRAIVLQHHALHPQPPLCCLKPLPSADPPEGPEDILLSFEEWKLKQFQAHSQIPAQVTSSARTETSDGHTVGSQDAHHSTPPADVPSPSQDHSYARDSVPPHFRVPITDRFNYANMDCSARVHMAHKSAKSASSILSSKKDWYMLSPCCKNGEAQFVVVELCDDIRIDTVQLANFEFFSGVFKDFTVRVAKTYPASEDGWTFAGTYRARNVRGVQSFHPPTSLRDFYRYIRIDFHSHYGHEYYCPISLLRVYGLTHLEQWKWDIWEAESRARLQEQRPLIADATQASANLVQQPSSTDNIHAFMDILESGSMNTSTSPQTKASSSSQKRSTSQTIDSSSSTGPMTASPSSAPVIVHDQLLSITHRVEEESPHVTPSTPPSSLVDTMSSIASIMSHSTSFTTTLNQPTSELSHHRPPESPTSLAASSTRTPSLSVSFDMPSSAAYSTMHSPIPSGESIFGAIMNRLTILEANHTLYVRYVEEQLAGVREVLKKLGEEVGRLESIGQMQAQMYRRTVQEWERQRLRLELEHSELLSRVNHLTDEVVLEKRLGIAQLCLLLAVLMFMGFTRGAPPIEYSRPRPVRPLGMRSLSFGSNREGGWNPLRLKSRSPAVRQPTDESERVTGRDTQTTFSPSPSRRRPSLTSSHTPRAMKSASSSASSLHKYMHGSPSTRTPGRNRPLVVVDPRALPRVLPLMKSNSSSASTHSNSRSARRLARTAHLHEVKLFQSRHCNVSKSDAQTGRDEVANDDVFVVSRPLSSLEGLHDLPRIQRGPYSPRLHASSTLEENKDGDTWIDTDMDGSEFGTDTAAYDST